MKEYKFNGQTYNLAELGKRLETETVMDAIIQVFTVNQSKFGENFNEFPKRFFQLQDAVIRKEGLLKIELDYVYPLDSTTDAEKNIEGYSLSVLNSDLKPVFSTVPTTNLHEISNLLRLAYEIIEKSLKK